MTTRIYPVLLCGGSGTRLWPLSRASYPKQFAALLGAESLFQASARRLSQGIAGLAFAAPLTITNSDFRFVVAEQLTAIGIDPGAILIEPEGRNTAPAVLAAALHLAQVDPEAVMLVAPSDHLIPDTNKFLEAVRVGLPAVERGDLVTFGIAPTRPETGYGYLQLEADPDGSATPIALRRFVEKPGVAEAQKMLASGDHLWNAGIFLFRARDIIAAFTAHANDLIAPVSGALADAQRDLGFIRLAPAHWRAARDVSIDYAVMEKVRNLSVVPYTGAWSDLGDWDAVWREARPDETGTATSERATAIECSNTLLRSEAEGVEIVGIGLDNIVAVAMQDAVLVAARDRAQDVKQAVSRLKARGAKQASALPRDYRPWGWFESLAMGARFQVKRIVVHPGASLSLQSHFHRSEHWIVVEGTAEVTIDADRRLVGENQSVYIPLGAVHRLRNPGKLPMVLIEVQTGTYLGEDDIVRYEDAYARV